MITTAHPAKSALLTPTDGEHFTIIGGGVRMLIDGALSGGRCCMFEAPIPPGEGPPLHRHEREDELFYVLEGRFKFSLNGEEFIGEKGAFVCAPKGSLHAFKNIGSTAGNLLVTCTPAGIEVPFRAVRVPDAAEIAAGQTPLTAEQAIATFAKHGITFHGPPLS